MSRIDELIAELCLDGVEYRPLEKCCKILDNKRKPVTKAARETGEYPYYGANGIQDYVSEYIFDGTFVLVGEDGSVITKAGTPVVTWAEGKIWVNNHAHIIEEVNDVLLRFLFHFIQTINVSPLIHGNIPKLTGGDFRALSIAIPPLPIQEEIVRILDQFTSLEAELKAELEARKKQYEYYSKEIFSSAENIEMVRIGDLGTWSGGMTPSMSNKAYWENASIPWISSKDMKNSTITDTQDHITELAIEETSAKLLPANITTIVARSGILKHTLPVVFVPFCTTVNQDIKALIVREDILPRYAYFVISAHSKEILRKTKKSGGTVDSLDVQAFMNYTVPVVERPEQERLISILERFDTLVNDISQGLPAEIEARHKQYEYYRDKLLTFKEKVS